MKKQIASRRRKSQSGNALIESALFFPVIVFMCFGVVDYSRLFALNEQAVSAARSGAAVALYNPTAYTGTTVSAAALQALTDAASADAGANGPNVNPQASVFYSCANSDGTDGAYARTMPSAGSCTTGIRIYVQVKTSIASNSVASYPAIVYPSNVYGTAVVRVQ